MNNLIQTLAFILPIIATLCVLCVLCVSIYFKIRRRIPVNVNCWFCNEWTKVHYDNYNSFICPKCLQYNGFDQEGGYNRVLPEQHDELLNQQVPLIQKNIGVKLSNGLCHICNNNQKLKIYQLANFVPLNEDAYDIEVEHFQKQLEKAYKLCGRCEEVVKTVVTTQNRWLLGLKMKILKTKGASFLNQSTNSLSKKSKHSFLIYLLNFLLILFAFITFIFAFNNTILLPENVNKETFDYVTTYTYPLFNIINNTKIPCLLNEYLALNNIYFNEYFNTSALVFKNMITNNSLSFDFFNNIDVTSLKSLYLNRPNVSLLCLTGLLIQVVLIFSMKNGVYKNIKPLLLWCSLLALTWSEYFDEFPFVIHPLQVVTSAYVIYTFITNFKGKEKIQMELRRKSSKIPVNKKLPCEEDLSDQEEDILSNFSSDVFNSTLKPKQPQNEIDTAESDCSFETIRSKYTSTLNPFKEPLPRVNSPLTSYKPDHIFGKPPSFQCHLTSSPVPFGESYNRNSVHSEPFSCCKKLSKCSASFKDLNRSASVSVCGKSNISKDVAFCGFDLNQSLDNLHLGKTRYDINRTKRIDIKILKSSSYRPILSPPKLLNGSYNAWPSEDSAWKRFKDINVETTNFSSSSSQSSGFASQSNDCQDLKIYSQYIFKHRPFIRAEYNNFTPDASHQERFNAYRNNDFVNIGKSPWQAAIKKNSRVIPTDHLFKPIQNNVISSEKLINNGCYKNYSSNNSSGRTTTHCCNYT